jgi:two-component system, chemotaxis family, sensor kinase CheA
MTQDEKLNLIFRDSFSTSQETPELSGRGVGMGAVKSVVEKLGGTILVTSENNKGTSICIQIPKPLSTSTSVRTPRAA